LTWLAAQTTGKIKGVVKDDQNDPLPGAFVTIEGTTMGSQTDENGYYYIIGVRAGTYNLKCQFVGFQPSEKKGISVKVGLTATVDFKMTSGDVQLKTVEVYATQDKVEKGKTTSERSIDVGALETSVQSDVAGVLGSQAGVKKDASGELHFRGGRSGEVGYVIDGATLGDPTGGSSTAPAINFADVESFTIQKGVPEADVGNALSGSVNIVKKIGDQKRTSGYAKYSTDAFMGDNKFDYNGGEFGINGPIPFTDGMKMRPTYYFSTDMSTQNGFKYAYKNPGTSDYFDFGDDDLTGFGFDMPIKRDNSFNMTFKTAYDLTEKIKVSATVQNSRAIKYGYEQYYKYSPESASKSVENVFAAIFNYRQTIDMASYYELLFSYYNRKYENMSAGKTPDQFIRENDVDYFDPAYDIDGNKVRTGGLAEGYNDKNKNGLFDREFFIDADGNGNYDNGELYVDANKNGLYDGDILYDSNTNGLWDYFETNQSFNGFANGVTFTIGSISATGSQLTGVICEGFQDKNLDGTYNSEVYGYLTGDSYNDINRMSSDSDEPYLDGDSYNDIGEPFVDWWVLRVNTESQNPATRIKLYADGVYNNASLPTVVISKSDFKASFPNDTITNFIWSVKVSPDVTVKVTYTETETEYLIKYPPEPFLDLPSTYGSQYQTSLRVNQAHDSYNGSFDEYEAYCKGIYYFGKTPSQQGYQVVNDGYAWEGSSVVYYGPDPASLNKKISEVTPLDYNAANHNWKPTWIDRNNTGYYEAPNGKWDSNESYTDYNKDGGWNRADLFAQRGTVISPSYQNHDNKSYKLKGSYSNQIDKYNLITTGFEGVMYDFQYLNIQDVQSTATNDATTSGLYQGLGGTRTDYQFKPLEFSFYIKDKMEFEDLVVNSGVRLDLRHLDDDAKKTYELRKLAKIPGYEEDFDQTIFAVSPRFGISHSVSETSKLYFSYGHMYQLPDYTKVFDPNSGGSATSVYGNMNLKFEKIVSYELGVANEMGNYLLDVTGYFKDIYDNINTKKYPSLTGEEYNVWINSDYGKTRGVEFQIDRALDNHFSWNIAYTLSYAYGKSSSARDNANADDATDIKIREFPLDWDERHSLNGSVSLVFGKDELINGLPYTDNWSVSLSSDYGSGKPFTPSIYYFADENGITTKSEKDIERNSERLPWTSNTDLRISKSFDLNQGEVSYGKLKFDFDVLNLFDKVNVQEVYKNTGSAYDPGVVNGSQELLTNPNRSEFYKNPGNVSERRNYKFSVNYSW